MKKKLFVYITFFESFANLGKQERKIVKNKLELFSKDVRGEGFKVHPLERANSDPSFRSARINDDLRLILAQKGSKYILLHVDHHDKAYEWAEGKTLKKSRFNAIYLQDFIAEEKEKGLEVEEFSFQELPALLVEKNIRKKDLINLGVPEVHADYLMEIKNDDRFLEFISFFPEEIQEGLVDIVSGAKTVTEVFAELEDQRILDEENFGDAFYQKDSRRRVYVVDDFEEFSHLLDEDIEKWRIFLHPKQEEIVKTNFNGPALIEGGPGTGKTVVGLHRAVYLAENDFPAKNGFEILLCTFSKKLSRYLEEKIKQLIRPKKIGNNIKVFGVDELIFKLLKDSNLLEGAIDQKRIEKILEEEYLKSSPDESLDFFLNEYKEVIQKNQIKSLDHYLNIERVGLKKPLHPSKRKEIWPIFEDFLERKEKERIIDFEDMAWLAFESIEDGSIQPCFDSVIIDEVQDLSPIKIKVLAGLSKSEKNGLMMLSDQNQRIFKLTSWKNEVDLPIVGRTYYLNINYRTTKQIREFADKQFFRSEKEIEHLKGYKSLLNGPEPLTKEFSEEKLQDQFIVKKIKQLMEIGINEHEVCVITPMGSREMKRVLDFNDIPCQELKEDLYPKTGEGVCVSTLFGAKGLEFRVVFIPYFNEIGRSILEKEPNDWFGFENQKQKECLKYVASTRAREQLIITSLL